jgi:hypothetical protein
MLSGVGTREALEERKFLAELMRQARETLRDIS